MGSIQHRPDRPKPWRARYRGPDGRQRSRSFTRKTDAERWLREELSKVDRGTWGDPRAGRVLFYDQSESWMAGRAHLRPSTRARDESVLRSLVLPAFGSVPVAGITSEAIEAWMAKLLAEGKSPATVRKAHELLGGVLDAAVRARRLGVNPARGVRLPRLEGGERQFLTADEIMRLADAIDPPYRHLVLLGGFAGLRLGELSALRPRSFSVGHRAVTITETLTEVRGHVSIGPPKTRASVRTVALPSFLADGLAQRCAGLKPDDLVFTGPEGGPLRPTLFRRRVWRPAVEAAGLEGVTPHALRHSHAAMLIAQGEHPLVVAKRLGHTSVTTVLDVYGHLFAGIDREAADRLDAVAQAWPKPSGEVVALVPEKARNPR